jgi:serine phosphatase RsbU (regulator of sigma subunit)
LLNAARAFSSYKPGAMLFSVLAEVENFVGNQHREDDIALIVLRRLGTCKMD